ncbi:DUF3368 domain-containing protein [bacterium]|nr:DUF3368 domain-containing protein [bacterium]
MKSSSTPGPSSPWWLPPALWNGFPSSTQGFGFPKRSRLVKAKQQGQVASLADCLRQMRKKGIWISEGLRRQALAAVDEPTGELPSS